MPNSFTITGSGDTAACTRACWLLAACEAVWLPAAFLCRLAAALEPVLLPACFAMMAWTPRSNQSSQQLAPLRHGQHATALTSRPYSPQRWLLTPDSAPVACRSEARSQKSNKGHRHVLPSCVSPGRGSCSATSTCSAGACAKARPAARGTVRASWDQACCTTWPWPAPIERRQARGGSQDPQQSQSQERGKAKPVDIDRGVRRAVSSVAGSGVLVLGQGRPPVSSCWVPWQMTWRLMWTCVALGFWLGCAWFLGVEGCRLLSLTTCGCNTGGRRD